MASKQRFCSVDMWAVDERVLASIRGTGLEYFRDVARDLGNNQHSNDLVSGLSAIYDNKKFCFSLPQSSRRNKPKLMFFGCEDILYLTGLNVMGELVTNGKKHYAVAEGSGYRVDGLPPLKADTLLKGKHRTGISLKSLREQFQSVPITTDEQELEGYTNAYVLYLVGTVIIPTTNCYVPLGYLGSIVGGNYRTSAWGVAMLAHIHRCLGMKRNYLGGNMYVLIVWAFEHNKDLLKAVFPGEYQKPDGRIDRAKLPSIYPLSLAWAKLISKKFGNKHLGRHVNFKQLLDCKEVTWRPYTRFPEDFLPQERQNQLRMKFYRGALLHPMHNNDHPIFHYPEKAPRHLGPKVKKVLWNEVCDLVPHRKRYDAENLALFWKQWDRKDECLVQLLDQARTASGAVAPEAEPRVTEEGLFLSNLLHQVMPLISQAATREPGHVPAEAENSSEYITAEDSSTVMENSNVGTSRRHSQSDCDETPGSKRQKMNFTELLNNGSSLDDLNEPHLTYDFPLSQYHSSGSTEAPPARNQISINLEDDNGIAPELAPLKRPIGRKAAKEANKKAKSNEQGDDDEKQSSKIRSELEEFRARRLESDRIKAEQLKLLIDIEQKQVALREKEIELQARSEEAKIMSMDTSSMNPLQAEYIISLQKEILAKRAGKNGNE